MLLTPCSHDKYQDELLLELKANGAFTKLEVRSHASQDGYSHCYVPKDDFDLLTLLPPLLEYRITAVYHMTSLYHSGVGTQGFLCVKQVSTYSSS